MENNYRFEKKFFIFQLTKQEVENNIKFHPAVFSEIYYERFINNIYLDSFDLRNYFDNANGVSERRKLRIRWYGNMLGRVEKPVLEIKTKISNLGYKISYPLTEFFLDKDFTIKTLKDIFIKSQLSQTLKNELFSLEFTLLNRYKRKYFQSKDKTFRITLDSEMQFYSLLSNWNNFLNKRTSQENIILELKCNSKQKQETISFITNFLPHRATKSSKYALGVEALNPW
ncbi:MAG: VTC domain-containing protein [Candidatus Pacebacteria bacterium]|nr:VTC domain-containing protein [Candidatus Paceibacterota bacterium]